MTGARLLGFLSSLNRVCSGDAPPANDQDNEPSKPGELFVFAEEPISLSELARRAGTSLGGAHKEMERLGFAGLVRSTTFGRNRLIEANSSLPVYLELRDLLLKTLGPEPLLRIPLVEIGSCVGSRPEGCWERAVNHEPPRT